MFGAKPPHNPNGDYQVQGAPSDCISSLTWSPRGCPKTLLVATSWDKSVKVWEVQKTAPNPTAQVQASKGPEHNHDMPVLCSAISRDGRIFTGGCDKMVKCWELAANKPPYQVAQHDQPIKGVSYIDDMGILVTGGWDSSIRFWDLRQSQPAKTIQLSSPFVSMDCSTFPMATFLLPREVLVYDLQNNRELKKMEPHNTMKEQLRCIANFPDVKNNPGFAVGSLEGRVCVMFMNENPASKDCKNFSFKCHREGNNGVDVYPVHGISFHPVFGTFATCGGNGGYVYWDKDSKQRLKAFSNADQPIPCGSFNDDGVLYGYAVSYDWAKGQENYNPSKGHHILIHSVEESEVKSKPPKPGAKTGGRR
eukprot:NODE_3475_length_1345_cov_39.079378_g3036_i0.p1 GENE.NODE_3475_length_1345_cov_39.079378_g3036_i0~~NODE_3475_length_1345_cov_39.079378_g3036_i0.p1  ORF type:complete len:382 (+),score=83.35 NODE_3475_length_1345_cov_39.079378_g3036_i0:57-1148(+)